MVSMPCGVRILKCHVTLTTGIRTKGSAGPTGKAVTGWPCVCGTPTSSSEGPAATGCTNVTECRTAHPSYMLMACAQGGGGCLGRAPACGALHRRRSPSC